MLAGVRVDREGEGLGFEVAECGWKCAGLGFGDADGQHGAQACDCGGGLHASGFGKKA